MYCIHCGRELEEGKECLCLREEIVPEEKTDDSIEISVEQSNLEQPWDEQTEEMSVPVYDVIPPVQKGPNGFSRFLSVLKHYIPQPIRAIKQAGEFGDKSVGLFCCLLQSLLIAASFCFYLITRVQVSYSLGFFEQAIPFGEYLKHADSSMTTLFWQLAGMVLLADFFLILLFWLLTGEAGKEKGFSKMMGGVGTALLSSGLTGVIVALLCLVNSDFSSLFLFSAIILCVMAVKEGVVSTVGQFGTKLFYLFPLTLLIWLIGIIWFVSSNPTLSWVFGLL